MSDVQRLPSKDFKIGSCPECGRNIWESHMINTESFNNPEPERPYYKCPICKKLLELDDIIPF